MVHSFFVLLGISTTVLVGWIDLNLSVVAAQRDNRIDNGVITSTHQIQILFRSEKSFVMQLSDFADRLEELTNSIRIYSNSFEEIRPRQGHSQSMQNPINAHLLIRHLAIGWPALKTTFKKFDQLLETANYLKSREDRESLPTRTEMESSESALVRLIGVYHLNSTQFVKGILASKSFDEIQSDRRLTIWDLGRLSIGLLNQQYFTPTIQLLDESIRMFQKIAQQGPTGSVEAPTVKFSTNSSPLIMPAVTNENMRSEDLLEIKLTAMKQHDEILDKVMKKEIESCGEGLQTSPYNTRRLKHLTVSAVQEKFEHSFKLQLNKIPTPFMEREQTLRLCRGQDLRGGEISSKLRCRLSRRTFPPIKLEDISIRPSIILAHEMMTSSQISQIIRLAASRLEANGGGPSMSFKSVLLDDTVIQKQLQQLAFVRRVESITTTKVQPGIESEFAVVRNYGIAGTFGIHSDFRGESFAHPILGERLATVQLYLTPVLAGGYTVFPRIGAFVRPQSGTALIYWNVNSSGQLDPLTVNSDCPVVYGNKWVLTHWINANANFHTQKCFVGEP